MKKILFVCTGNTCRSPMAEALLIEKGKKSFEAKSAGVFAADGQAASPQTIDVLKEKGISMNHQSKPLDEQLMNWADVVLTMTENHKLLVEQQFPQFHDKVHTLKEYVGDDTDRHIWEQLQQYYAELETKRAVFLAQYNGSPGEQQEAMNTHLKTEIEKIQSLESRLPTRDISDPFGGSVDMYRFACDEIEALLDQLVDNHKE